MSQYICHATLGGRKAGRLFTNTAQSVDRLYTNKADNFFYQGRLTTKYPKTLVEVLVVIQLESFTSVLSNLLGGC